MLEEEGLDNVFARHHRLAEATRRAVRTWRQNDGPEIFCDRPRRAIGFGDRGADARGLRRRQAARRSRSTGSTCRSAAGSARCKGRLFRIGHLGDLNEPMVLGAIATVEMALDLAGVPHGKGGVQAAADYLVNESADCRD